MKLIITEKPKVAFKIANALGKPVKKKFKNVPFYEIPEKNIVVAPAVGHLYELAEKNSSYKYPTFDVEWKPAHLIDKSKKYVKDYIELIKKLAEKADEIYIATDYDIEGELLGYNIYRFACLSRGLKKPVKRLIFSALTKADLKKAYENPSSVNMNLVNAGEARHVLDWFWGINISRALTHSARSLRFVNALSAGRVQTPTLAILVKRELEIENFKPREYFEIHADIDGIDAVYKELKIFEKEEAEKIYLSAKKAKRAVVKSLDEKTIKVSPPYPFDLGTLQRDAYSFFGFSPKKTLNLAQNLYEGGYISYPRTSSQKLPKNLNFRKIISELSSLNEFKKYCEHLLKKEVLKPVEGKQDDPAHPAIYPTGIIPKDISKDEWKLYKLIVSRFLACFSEPLIRKSTKILFDINGLEFIARGSIIAKKGWSEIYPISLEEKEIPKINAGDILKISKIEMKKKKTKPPKRYTPASLIRVMEKLKLGTKATRAEIIDILYKRGYITGKNIKVTKLGFAIINALKDRVPDIVSEKLTRIFEERLEKIQLGKESKYKVIEDAKKQLIEILKDFDKYKDDIGKKIIEAMENRIAECTCGGDLIVLKSKKGNNYVMCKNCKKTFPLPKKYRILKRKCKCGLPLISFKVGKKTIHKCLDIDCRHFKN